MSSTNRLLSEDPNAAVLLSDDPNAASTEPARTPDRPPGFATLWDQMESKNPGSGRALQRVVAPAGRFVKEATAGLNPVTMLDGLGKAFFSPIKTGTALLSAQDNLRVKGVDAFKRGDYVTGARNFAEWMVPVLGPRMSQAGDMAMEGDIAGGLGAATDVAIQVAGPKVAGRIRLGRTRPLVPPRLSAEQAAAVQFGRSEGIPMDLSTVTGSRHAANIQKRLSGTAGGASVVEEFQDASQAALRSTGKRLAQEAGTVSPGLRVPPQTGFGAGKGVIDALNTTIRNRHVAADGWYTKLDNIQDAQAQRIAQTGGQQAPPGSPQAFTNVPLAVDVTAANKMLAPMLADLLAKRDISGALMGAEARVALALDKLSKAKGLQPLSLVDDVLGDLKALAGYGKSPQTRTRGEAAAANAVQYLDDQVLAAARRGGPDALKALQEGRKATVAKYQAIDVLDMLNDEPGKVFAQLTAGKDSAVKLVRSVKSLAPNELPKVARGFIEQLLEKSTREGGFARGAGIYEDWNRLGSVTKQELFGGQLTKDLDNFFLLAKKLGVDKNPSGTATTVNVLKFAELAGWVPAKVMAKMLFNPASVRALSTGFRMSVNATATKSAAWTAAIGQLQRAADAAGVELPDLEQPAATQERR